LGDAGRGVLQDHRFGFQDLAGQAGDLGLFAGGAGQRFQLMSLSMGAGQGGPRDLGELAVGIEPDGIQSSPMSNS
jgi:hypothetical protein